MSWWPARSRRWSSVAARGPRPGPVPPDHPALIPPPGSPRRPRAIPTIGRGPLPVFNPVHGTREPPANRHAGLHHSDRHDDCVPTLFGDYARRTRLPAPTTQRRPGAGCEPGTAYVGHTGWSAGHHAEHWPARHGPVSRFRPFLSPVVPLPAISSTVPPVAAGASCDHEEGDTARCRWRQRRAGEGTTGPDFELAQPPSSAWGIARRPPSRRVPGDDDVGALQPVSRRHQSPQECHRDGEGRVRHDPEGALRKPEIERIGHDHGDVLCPNRSRSSAARRRCRSTATTRAPRSTSGAVRAPRPAPTSRTRSTARISASATMRAVQVLPSWWNPHRARTAGTAYHHEIGHRPNGSTRSERR